MKISCQRVKGREGRRRLWLGKKAPKSTLESKVSCAKLNIQAASSVASIVKVNVSLSLFLLALLSVCPQSFLGFGLAGAKISHSSLTIAKSFRCFTAYFFLLPKHTHTFSTCVSRKMHQRISPRRKRETTHHQN